MKAYKIFYRGAGVREVLETEKTLDDMVADLHSGWLVTEDRIINAEIVEQIVEVKESNYGDPKQARAR